MNVINFKKDTLNEQEKEFLELMNKYGPATFRTDRELLEHIHLMTSRAPEPAIAKVFHFAMHCMIKEHLKDKAT